MHQPLFGSPFAARVCTLILLLVPLSGGGLSRAADARSELRVLPEAGRTIYLEAFQRARKEIRIEICVLEDPQILQSLKQAIEHGVHVRAIVDRGKYLSLTSERMNLAAYLTGPGGKLHLSNPIFPRSFPKVILIDGEEMLIGSACLDTDTFEKCRDYVYATDSSGLIEDLSNLFENDWAYTVPVGGAAPPFNSTPIINDPSLIVGPVSATDRLVSLIQNAKRTLDITTELLGNLTLESELAAAVGRGVEVRLISPISVNGAAPQVQKLQGESLSLLKAAGLQVHVTGPTESPAWPYMHARSALADNELLYIGSISLSPDSATVNREAGILISDPRFVDLVKAQFETDFQKLSHPY